MSQPALLIQPLVRSPSQVVNGPAREEIRAYSSRCGFIGYRLHAVFTKLERGPMLIPPLDQVNH